MALSGINARSTLRDRDRQETKVSAAELFFDLVYVFAVTQISHHLLHHLTGLGALQVLVLWCAVWLGWQYTCWVTNWFDADRLPVRLLLFAVMLVAMLMAIALPEAFGATGLLFAASYATLQVGRTVVVLLLLGRGNPLAPNFRRILAWLCLSAAFWIAGGLAEGAMRLALWGIAVACEYGSPMVGFWTPRMGRSRTSDWTIAGGHLRPS
jgi:low temperature requirement protein LtrA